MSRRIYTFDLLRGLAVLTMMLAHSVYFFHSRDNQTLLGLELFGNTVSFVTFLLVSGAVTWVAYFSGHSAVGPINRQKVLTRIVVFLAAYYVLALLLSGRDILQTEGLARLRLIGNVLLFRHLPGFTEFFPPFIFYSALLSLFPRIFAAASRTMRGVVLISLLSFLLGFLLYQLPVNAFYRPWVALLAGADGLYRFPVLQYLPVFLLGLHWGRETLATESLSAKRIFATRFAWWFGWLAVAAWLLSSVSGISRDVIFSRWPPSIPFLALGLAFAFTAAALLYLFRQLRSVVLLRDLLLVFGQNAVGLFWSHILLLGLYAMAGGAHVSSPWLFLALFALLVLVSLAVTTFLPFNFRFSLTAIRGSREEEEEALERTAIFQLSKDVAAEAVVASRGLRSLFWANPAATGKPNLKKRHQFSIAAVALATAALVIPAATEEVAIQRQARGSNVWWSNAYAYRQPVTLYNPESFVTLKAGDAVVIHFNHQTLVEQGQSRADGQDIQLVYWTGEQHLVADSQIINPVSEQAALQFRLPADLHGGQPDQYYDLYYGAFATTATLSSSITAPTSLNVRYGPAEIYPFVASLTKRWSLIGNPEDDTVSFHLTSAQAHETDTVTYEFLDTNVSGPMVQSSETSWEADIPVALLPTGAYRLQARLIDAAGRTRLSQITGFYRSAPLYVAWTNDWEGYDINQSYLDAMITIADQHNIPLTHFFNPRIYATETIRPERARSMTQWLQRRLQLGDGYGLHLHLFHDFVEQAGVTVREEPNWGDNGSGYGVPLSAYTKAEQTQLIDYGNDLLFTNGLPRATIFRAGGWFANLDTLAALDALGFAADSSARTAYTFGRNKLPGHWNVSSTTRPYFPARTDQNSTAQDDTFPVLEIPNNGADSYAFSAEAMIDRFNDNLGDGLLIDPQQITFLSHPHWFDDKEQARVRELFDRIGQYAYADDHGPVIYATTQQILEVFANAE